MLKDLDKLKDDVLANAILIKDKTRKNTYNYFIARTKEKKEYIQISISKKNSKIAEVKTMFITTESRILNKY